MAAVGGDRLRVGGTVRVPGDKSISHRALLLAALAGVGRSRVTGILDSADVRSTAAVLRAMGAEVPELAPEMHLGGASVESDKSSRICPSWMTRSRTVPVDSWWKI